MVNPISVEKRRIYIDANVLINYCTKQPSDYAELKRLFSARSGAKLVTSNLAIVQTIAKLQTKTKSREQLGADEIKRHIKYFYAHCNIYEVKNNDIKDAMDYPEAKDLEDNIHFIVSQRLGCDMILTNNKKDFTRFNVIVRSPRKVKPRTKK